MDCVSRTLDWVRVRSSQLHCCPAKPKDDDPGGRSHAESRRLALFRSIRMSRRRICIIHHGYLPLSYPLLQFHFSSRLPLAVDLVFYAFAGGGIHRQLGPSSDKVPNETH
jgi:hypothetical protein